jgi:hypothetical protein
VYVKSSLDVALDWVTLIVVLYHESILCVRETLTALLYIVRLLVLLLVDIKLSMRVLHAEAVPAIMADFSFF